MQDANDIELNTLADGACAEYPDPDLFITEKNQTAQSPRTKLAKLICNTCVVQDLCLQEGLELKDDFSIRAGTMPSERRKMRGLKR